MGHLLGLGNLLELGWLGNGLDNLLSIGLLKIFYYFLSRFGLFWVGVGLRFGLEQGGGGAVVPVLYDTVVAVAVVVEIDLEVKESVVHYCSVVVIKSFGAIINVLVSFPIFVSFIRSKKACNLSYPYRMREKGDFRPTK